ncbi:MAG: pyridoxal phosphate-dependent aminotransferase [Phycisphaerae bacterium]|nr:pyridoxal phosphate-dependent aminotransferase [Phycisphaerae bacterium]
MSHPLEHLISARARVMQPSGIRRILESGLQIKNPINLSIGQPDFPVPEPMKQAAIDAIRHDRNGYSLTAGAPELLDAAWAQVGQELGWHNDGSVGLFITAGTSGALLLMAMALLDPGDEFVVPDPFFPHYPQLCNMTQSVPVSCDTYPDFRMTADRIERCITPKTKAVLICSPSNPCGTVLNEKELRDIVDLCKGRQVQLISDEIYDEFVFGMPEAPTPARFSKDVLLIRGFGKTYGCTGWRLGYTAGPVHLIQQMTKVQQYTFVCAPTPLQVAAAQAHHCDLSDALRAYERRRDMVIKAFEGVVDVPKPEGAFYAFVPVPERLGMTATKFCEKARDRRVLVVPGGVFSARDTHFRISFAVNDAQLAEGLQILRDLMLGN